MAERFNLARRPFVDTRPANLTAGLLAVLVVVSSFVASRTVIRYFADSKRTRTSIAALKDEILSLEKARRDAEASLASVDVAGLAADVEGANEIAVRRAFSWTRFLSRLEKTLPPDIRISSIGLQKVAGGPGAASAAGRRGPTESAVVNLTLISRDPNGLPRTIRAFDQSPWFDLPLPASEDRGEKGLPEGRRLVLSVQYHDVEIRKEAHP